jgi:hypothetical protein
MNKNEALNIINIFETEVADILKKHGYQIETGNASYSDSTITFKSLRVNLIGSLNKEAEQLESHIEYLQGYSKWLLKTHEPVYIYEEMKPQNYKLVGYSPRSKKYPYIVEDEKGQGWKVKESLVRRYFSYPNEDHPDYFPKGTPLNKLPDGINRT